MLPLHRQRLKRNLLLWLLHPQHLRSKLPKHLWPLLR